MSPTTTQTTINLLGSLTQLYQHHRAASRAQGLPDRVVRLYMRASVFEFFAGVGVGHTRGRHHCLDLDGTQVRVIVTNLIPEKAARTVQGISDIVVSCRSLSAKELQRVANG